MRLLHISDIHCSYSKLKRVLEEENYDLAVITGDFECYEISDILSDFANKTLAITGNMDDSHIDDILSELGININCQIQVVKGYSFIGISGRGHDKNVEMAIKTLSNLNTKVDVILSHYPPYGTKVDKAIKMMHVGSRSLNKLVAEYKPKYLLCGHIHESPGIDKLGSTIIINPGPLGLRGSYAIIKLDTGDIKLKKL